MTFISGAVFAGVTFTGDAWFSKATGLGTAGLDGARVAPAAERVERVWPPAWRVEAAAGGWQTLHLTAAPEKGGAAAGGPGPEPGS